jgi:hypothetical protein
MDGRDHLLYIIIRPLARSFPEPDPGKSDQCAETLAVQLAGIFEDDMLLWVLSIMFILRLAS